MKTLRHRHILAVACVTLTSFWTCAAHGNDAANLARRMSAERKLTVPRANSAPSIDGRVDDACWADAQVAGDFVVVGGAAVPREETEARILYDDSNMYVAFVCHNPTQRALRASANKHDEEVWRDDSVELLVDSAGWGNTYHQFIVNSRGACMDLKGMDVAWNGIIDVATQVEADRWTVEMAIPLATLDAGRADSADTWGVNFCRNISDRTPTEASSWSPVAETFQSPKHFGRLDGIKPDPEGFSVTMEVTPPQATWVGVNKLSARVKHNGAKPFAGTVVAETAEHKSQPVAVSLEPGQETQVTPEIQLQSNAAASCVVKLVRSSDNHIAAMAGPLNIAAPQAFTFRVAKPSYRALVFPSMKLKEIVFAATVGLDPVAREGSKVSVQVIDSLETRTMEVGPVDVTGTEVSVPMSIEGLPPDSYRVFGKLTDRSGSTMGVETVFTILPPPAAGKEVWIDDGLVTRINGEPFLPIATSLPGLRGVERMNAKLAQHDLPPVDPRKVCQAMLDLGINTVHAGSLDRNFMDMAEQAGLYVITDQITGWQTPMITIAEHVRRLSSHPALLGYYSIDEMAMPQRHQAYETGLVIHALDPYHPFIASLYDPGRAPWLAEIHDVLMPDEYPIGGRDITRVAMILDSTRARAGRPIPMWFYMQAWDYATEKDGRMPTDDEMRVMSYLALNHGARGLSLFAFYARWEQAITKSALTDFANDPFWSGWRLVTREAAALQDVWLAPDSSRQTVTVNQAYIDIMTKAIGNQLTVVAVNPTTQSREVEIQLPDGVNPTAGAVLFEDRSVSHDKGRFTDTFGDHAVHVYRFERSSEQ